MTDHHFRKMSWQCLNDTFVRLLEAEHWTTMELVPIDRAPGLNRISEALGYTDFESVMLPPAEVYRRTVAPSACYPVTQALVAALAEWLAADFEALRARGVRYDETESALRYAALVDRGVMLCTNASIVVPRTEAATRHVRVAG
jgi:hypothetical protein